VPGLVAALIPIAIMASKRIDVSSKTLQVFFAERPESSPVHR